MYLTDADLVSFLKKANSHLKRTMVPSPLGGFKQGLLFVKENVHTDNFLVDREDNSIMRTQQHFEAIFEDAGFRVLRQFNQ